MLPATTISIRMIGDTSDAYWSASSEDGVHLVLETDERVLWTGRYEVRSAGAADWRLSDDTTLIVTDRRLAFLTTKFDTGGGWAGFGVVGLAVATTANVVSKSRAAARSAGKVAIGQVRHEWLKSVTLRRVKALIGVTDTYVDLTLPTKGGPLTLTLWGRPALTEDFARWLASVVAAHQMTVPLPRSAGQSKTLTSYGVGAPGSATGKRSDLTWAFPDDPESLIRMLAPLSARRSVGGTGRLCDRTMVGLCRFGVDGTDPETVPAYDNQGRLVLEASESVLWQGSAAAVVTGSAVAAHGREVFRTMWSSPGSETTLTLTDQRIVYALRAPAGSPRWTVAGQVHHRNVISLLALDGAEFGDPEMFRSVASLIDPPDIVIRVNLLFRTRAASCDADWIRAIIAERMASLPECATSQPVKWTALEQQAREPSYRDGHYGPTAQLPLARMLGSEHPR
jgi:hypothetical protein